MNWAQNLNLIGFSCWQIVVVVSVLVFRREVVQAIRRIRTVKTWETELELASERRMVRSLRSLKDVVSSSSTEAASARITQLLAEHQQHALENIALNSARLATVIHARDDGTSAEIDLTPEELRLVHGSLSLLEDSGLLSFSIEDVAGTKRLRKVRISRISGDLRHR